MWQSLAALLWPPRCPVCEGWYGDDARPWATTPTGPAVHVACVDDTLTHRRLRVGFAPDTWPVFALCDDSPGWFAALHRAKYGDERRLVVPWIEALADAVDAGGGWPSSTVVCPLPDDPARRIRRGFGVAEDTARHLVARCGGTLRLDLVRRDAVRASQSTLDDDDARRGNARDLYRVGRLAEIGAARPIVLVDDQVTSGATLAAAVEAVGLRGHAGALLALARARRAPARIGPWLRP